MPQERITEFGAVGLNSDVQPTLLPFNVVTEMYNCNTSDGNIHSIWGQIKIIDLNCRPLYHTAYLDSSQEQWVVISDGIKIWAHSIFGIAEEITPPTGNWNNGRVTFANLNGVLVVNSESNGLFYWRGAGNVLTPMLGPGSGVVGLVDAGVNTSNLSEVATAINNRDWTGHPKATGENLNLWQGDFFIFNVTNLSPPGYDYFEYNGPRPVTVGPSGSHTIVGSELVLYNISSSEIDAYYSGWNWDLNWRCLEIAAIRYNLVALGMTENGAEYPHKIRWSNSAEEGTVPSDWKILASNDAGDDILGETAGKIVTSENSRDQLFIIKEDSVYGMRWIGGQYVFQITRLEGGTGTRVPKGVAEVRGNLVILTTGDVIMFDGQNSDSIIDRKVRAALSKIISQDFWDHSIVYYHPPSSNIIIAGASPGSIGQLTSGLVYSFEENTWGHIHLGYGYGFDTALVSFGTGIPTWDELGDTDHIISAFDSDTLAEINPSGVRKKAQKLINARWIIGASWDEQIDGNWNQGVVQPSIPSAVLYESNEDDTQWWLSVIGASTTYSNNRPKTCRVRRTGIPLLGASRLVQINEVWPEIQGKLIEAEQDGAVLIDPETGESVESPIKIRIGVQDVPNGIVTWAKDKNGLDYFKIWPESGRSIDPRITGRFLCWEIESFGIGWWSLGALTFEYEDAGAVGDA